MGVEGAQVAGLPAGYVEIQLRFARRSVQVGTHDLARAVTQLTNLHRRFGFGTPSDEVDPRWERYLDGLDEGQDLAGQLRWTLEFARSQGAAPPPSTSVARVGPFSVQVEGEMARTHFVPRDVGDVSPLHPSQLSQRRRELRDVLAEARRLHPEIRRVRGTSWLYSTRSYRSIFPPAHIATAVVRTDVHTFQGSSAWGQFLDHRGGVKPDLAARFVESVDAFDGTAPWKLFPIPTLVVESPLEVVD